MSRIKESTQKKGILTDYYQTNLYKNGQKVAEGIANKKGESIERAYKDLREKSASK